MKPRLSFAVLSLALALIAPACGKNDGSATDLEETGQQLGDVMASIDEAGGSGGTLALTQPEHAAKRAFARIAPGEVGDAWWEKLLAPSAEASACSVPATFGICTGGNTLTRTFAGCGTGGTTFNGTVTLTWSANNGCQLATVGDSITRVPDFTMTGRRGATLSITKTGTTGQRITWSSGTGTQKVFAFSSDGIRRVFTSAQGAALLDYTTQTTSDITISGSGRSNRILNGGNLRVTNNLTQVTCDYVPSNITWSNGCNCPTSGTWEGSCSDGKTTSLAISGCGAGKLKMGPEAQSFSFDRCTGL